MNRYPARDQILRCDSFQKVPFSPSTRKHESDALFLVGKRDFEPCKAGRLDLIIAVFFKHGQIFLVVSLQHVQISDIFFVCVTMQATTKKCANESY